ncbi:MAG: penicillin acylase family protein [Deltaproteobacteria bacterium]|nr:penicillin acylase family protein [Deltaproteobacteria bacterium]
MKQKDISEKDFKAALPQTSGSFRLKGIEAPIEIYRDRFGIPHLSAKTVHDAFFGQGFVTAQDRLWHMDYDRRHAYGRLSEWFGSDELTKDITMRRFGIGATVKRDYQAVNAETRAMLDAYTAGVNSFIKHSNSLPIEYRLLDEQPEPWRGWDCFAVYKVRHIFMGVFEGKLWRAKLVNTLGPEKAAELLRGYQPGHLVIVPPGHGYDGPALDGLQELSKNIGAIQWLREHPEAGSNSWAVHGSRTATGRPFLAGDSHRLLDTPNVYYQNHIRCPEFDVIGLSFPGCPGFPHFGHNPSVAWCVTHAQADYQDLYVERFSAEDPAKYEFKGEWKEAEIRRETIRVRNSAPREIDVVVTQHGPIISGGPAEGYGLAFKYTATAAPYVGFECLLPMMRAGSVEEMDAAMEKWVDPCNNFLFSDTNGTIAYLHRGQVPIRPMANAWLPVPGWTGDFEWRGNIPFAEALRIQNPKTGFIVTANNRISDKDYPYYIALNYVPEYRARRIFERLDKIKKATMQDMKSVHGDRVSIPAQKMLWLFSRINPPDPFADEALESLCQWNGAMEPDAVAPTIYSAFRIKLLKRFLEHHVGSLCKEMFTATGRGAPRHLVELASVMAAMVEKDDPSLLPPGTTWVSMATDALSETLSFLKERFGDDMNGWSWGAVHHTQPKHPLSELFPQHRNLLNPASVGMGGDGDTPLAAGYASASPFAVTLLSVARYVYDLSDWDNSGWAVPLGVSGHPASSHYSDQLPVWSRLDLVPMLYDWELIAAQAESHQVLAPES